MEWDNQQTFNTVLVVGRNYPDHGGKGELKLVTIDTVSLHYTRLCDENNCKTCIMRFRCFTNRYIKLDWEEYCHISVQVGDKRPSWLSVETALNIQYGIEKKRDESLPKAWDEKSRRST